MRNSEVISPFTRRMQTLTFGLFEGINNGKKKTMARKQLSIFWRTLNTSGSRIFRELFCQTIKCYEFLQKLKTTRNEGV